MSDARATPFPRRSPAGKLPWLMAPGARFLSLLVIVAGLFLSGSLLRPMNGDADMFSAQFRTGGQETVAVQFLGAAIYAVAGVYFCWNFGKLRLNREIVLIVAAVGLAFCSVTWSVDPEVCLRRSVAFAGTTIFGLTLATSFSKQQILFLLNRVAIILFFATLLLMVLAPTYALHQSGEGAGFAGALRGSYPHKNALGHFLALFLTIFIISGRQSVGRWGYIASVVTGGLLLLATRNIGSIFGLIAAIGTLRGLNMMAAMKSTQDRIVFVIAILVGAALLYLIWETVFISVLDFVGKDATLSDRTLIWSLIWKTFSDNWLLGSGYAVAWRGTAAAVMQAALFNNINNAHNGFIQVWLELGVVGLALFLAIVVSVAINLLSNLQKLNVDVFSRVSVAFFVFLLVTNLANSTLMTFNDLNWCLVVTFGYLSAAARGSPRSRHFAKSHIVTRDSRFRFGLRGARRL